MPLTVDKTMFGAVGVSDPSEYMPQVAYRREIDFKKANLNAGVNYAFLPVSKGFVATGLLVEEIETVNKYDNEETKTANTITVKVESDSATLGSAVTLSGTTKAFTPAVVSKAFSAEDILCIVMAGDATEGKVGISVIGYCSSAESVAVATAPAWRNSLQDPDKDNVSGGNLED